ncbi:MAG: hypothetical protein QG641_262 [Candidatus Poribacteria bacterium]|nr:hypothetical protein [Candidatus Poribacteria bacterium]
MLNWDDRESIKEFIKQNNRKHQNDISQIEDKIISMYAKCMLKA